MLVNRALNQYRLHGVGSCKLLKAWLSTSAQIVAQDKSLVLLKAGKIEDNFKFKPGAIVENEAGSKKILIMFQCGMDIFGLKIFDDDRNNPNQSDSYSLLTTTTTTRKNFNLNELFTPPPRDIDRQVITEGWRFGVGSLDAMVPLGVGQSMLFFDREGKTFDDINNNSANYRETYIGDQTDVHLNSWLRGAHGKELDFDYFHGFLKHSDSDVYSVLRTLSSCMVSEKERDGGKSSVLVIQNFLPFCNIWIRSQQLRKSYNTVDRSELRLYYSQLIQRASRLKEGTGSLTMLLRIPFASSSFNNNNSIPQESNNNNKVYNLDDFLRECQNKTRPVSDYERLIRLSSVLYKKKQKLIVTDEMLKKMKILPPKQQQQQQQPNESAYRMHFEELMSLADGHVVFENDLGLPFDPRKSLTRIGTGTNKNDVKDTRSVLMRSVAPGFRIMYTEALESGGLRAVDVYNRALTHPNAKNNEALQCAAIYAATKRANHWRANDYCLNHSGQVNVDLPYTKQVDVLEQIITKKNFLK